MKLQTNAAVLEAAELAIYNTEKDAGIQKRVGEYGFSAKRIQEGKVLLQNALMLQDAKEQHYQEQWAISQQIEKDLAITLATFRDHVKVARVAFRQNPALLHSLKVGRIATRTWECIQQAQYFYIRLEVNTALTEPYGISQDIIQQMKASVASLLALKQDRVLQKGIAENSTQQKKKAFKALKAWVVEFRSLVRIAFKHDPQMMEVFGMAVPSSELVNE